MSDPIASLMERFSNYAMTDDGLPEIESLRYLDFESEFPAPRPEQRLAVVLVESRLLDENGSPALHAALMERLRRFKTDMRAEGLLTRFIAASVYHGPVQKDGRTVLALRRFLIATKAAFPALEGIVLVGNFPDTSLVRTVAWAPGFSNPTVLAIWPELISGRADIVLGDISGNWESLYRQEDFQLENISANPDEATTTRGWHDGEAVREVEFVAASYSASTVTFRDAFHIDDAIVEFTERTPNTFRLQLHKGERNPEVDVQDRTMANIIARPDIAVSRINARHVAVNPDPNLVGTDGHRFLDAQGRPQEVTSPVPLFPEPEVDNLFNFMDFDLERRLLNEYFDRNHRFRIGAYSQLPFRVGAISGTTEFNAHGYAQMMGQAASDFQPAVEVENATSVQYVDFLKTPAVLRYVMAHSDSRVSLFRNDHDDAGLGAAIGGPPARWIYDGQKYRTIYDGQSGIVDLMVHRALWQNATLANTGAFLAVHGGCDVNSIDTVQTATYTAPSYGHWSNSETFLFFTPCVGLMSRAKGFNDAPGGFAEGFRLSERANFGNCWRTYFNSIAQDASLTSYNIQRKRAYFWSLNGDWSLRLRNRNGIGIVGGESSLASVAVHPNRAWIDEWNFDAGTNPIRGTGDVDGDGVDEFVVTSDWGIGILKHDGISFRTLMQAPRDTWFGGWRWDATVNTGRDRVKAIDNFTGDGRREIMVWSNWGMATLAYGSGTLRPSVIHPNGSRLGGWLFDTATNRYVGAGRFVAGAQRQMVITSPWGMGILSLQRDDAVFSAPIGSRLGDWLMSADDRIQLVADLDGDGYDELLITSGWGIGVLKMINGTLRTIALYPNGTDLGGYIVSGRDDFSLADRLLGTLQCQVVVTNAKGIHILALSGSNMSRMAFAAEGSRIGGWQVGTAVNQLQRAGDLGGNGRADLLIRSPWGIGILELGDDHRLACPTHAPYGSMLGDWHLEAGDAIVGPGRLSPASAHAALLFTKA